MLKLKQKQQVMVLISDRWNQTIIGMSTDLIDGSYDEVGLDLDDWDVHGDKPESPGIYLFDFCCTGDDDDFPDDFFLSNPVLIFDFKGLLVD